VNTVSSIAGVILIPVSGIIWELFADLTIYNVLHLGTFNPIGWAATFALAVLPDNCN
jgi:hypothetical protein